MQSITESLRKQRELILEESSEQALDRHTSLLEVAIISLYNRLANRLSSSSEDFRAAGAIAAIGNFGRGLSSPAQTVPLLFLLAGETKIKHAWIEEITDSLEDAGWTMESSRGAVDDIAERGKKDSPFFFKLMNLRYISGNRSLVEQLEKEIDNHIAANRKLFLRALVETVTERRKLFEDARNWFEPSLEESPGGLFEIAELRAGCRVAANIRGLEDAIFQGYLMRQEVDFLRHAEKEFILYLTLLRSITGKTGSRLDVREQEALARRLGYVEISGFLPVEIFMQHVHQLFHGVSEVSREFWERLEESRGAKAEEPGNRLEEGVIERSGKIHIQTERYPATAHHLVHLFALAARHRLGLANVTRQWVLHNRKVLDTASGDASVKDEFLDLLRMDSPEIPVLRRFYDYGLMTALIPELTSVHGLIQHDAFHLYPVQEHHLRTCMELKKLIGGEYAAVQPDLTRVAAEVGDPSLLLLAGFLHDLGKSSSSGHAAKGGEMIPAIAKRLGLSDQEANTVQLLVSQHLLLLDNASMRDLADQEMLANATAAVGKPEYLDQLLVLTFADMMATGPRGQEKWRDTPVMELYCSIANILEKGEPSSRVIAEKAARVRKQLETRISYFLNPEELEAYFSQLVPRYLISISPEEIVKHLRMARHLQASGESFAWEVSSGRDTAEITVMSLNRQGFLAKSAGILTLHDLNIMGAQVFAMNDETTLLIFQCRLPEKGRTAIQWDAVRADVDRLLAGKLALDFRIAARSGTGRLRRIVREAPSKIVIDNDSSAMYTILEVYTVDRIGLLYTISRTLDELQVLISVAKISTKGDQVADVFYIRTDKREKVTDPEQIREMENALSYFLDGKQSEMNQNV
ncbi:MAG: HD domain-containing protein [Desulfobacteraceae bacterium]|nr:HD domain-containing protein [Desulfobacteraceae bacterium]